MAGNPSYRRKVGPVDPSAGDATNPVTLGEFMLMGDRQPLMRCLLIFLPRIAPELFPPENDSNQGATLQVDRKKTAPGSDQRPASGSAGDARVTKKKGS